MTLHDLRMDSCGPDKCLMVIGKIRRKARRLARARAAIASALRVYKNLYVGSSTDVNRNPIGKRMTTGVITKSINTTTGYYTLNAINKGTREDRREGNIVLLKHLSLHGYVYNDTTATINYITLWIIYDETPGKAQAAIADFMSARASFGFGNIKILWRKDIVLCGNSTTPATGKEGETVDVELDIPENYTTTWDSSVNYGVNGMIVGHLFMMFRGENGVGTTDATFYGSGYLDFEDI